MHLDGNCDDTKGLGYADQWIDDCVFWDSQGDNWNSRIATMADFPRISTAHVPTANGEWGDLDEVPPTGDVVTDPDDADAVYACEDLNIDGDPDYTDGFIQAVMVTRVDDDISSEDANLSKFNLYKGSDAVETDSEEGGRRIQFGFETVNDRWTVAGYYPWTIAEENWTEALFNSHEYGCYVLDGKTDQVTVLSLIHI